MTSPFTFVHGAHDRHFVHTMHSVLSFEDYYQRDYRDLVGLAFIMTGSRWAAEELAQDALAEAHRKWSTVGGYDDPGAWVRKVMVNMRNSLARRLATETKAMVRLRSRREALEESFEMTPRTDEIWATVRQLPRRQAQAVTLFYWEDRGVADIAEILGTSVETAKTHLKRGRASLAQSLQHHDGEFS